MKYILLDDTDIPFKIEKKKNRNTYFYFKKQGYIQINLSKHQTEKDALKYMKQNSTKFVQRFKSKLKTTTIPKGYYLLLGTLYKISLYDKINIELDHENKICFSLTDDVNNEQFKKYEKKLMLDILNDLQNQYKDNPYVNIDNINLKTRYTTSRHGSCNTKKRHININLNLLKYGTKYIEYVFLHEIAHLTVQNHSKEFYTLFEKLCPDYKQTRKELKELTR